MTSAEQVIRARPPITSQVIVLGLLCVTIAVARLRFIRDLPDWDVATYALIGNELAHGQRLYTDAWDMKPPGIFASFALAEWITRGSHAWSAYLLSTLASIATTIAIAFTRISPSPGTPGEGRGEGLTASLNLWAAALWTCVSLHPALGGYLLNTESFINAFLAIAIALSLRRHFILAGLAFAIATLFKQVAIAPAIAIAAWMLFARFDRPRRIVVMLAIIPLAWLIVFAYFAFTDRAEIFYQTNFVYSRYYGGNVFANLLNAFRPSHLFPRAMIELLPLVLIALLGIALTKRRSLLIALLIGSFIAIAMPGQFFEHYYQLWLVPLTLAGAVIASKHRVLGAIACVGLVVLQSHWWLRSPRERAMALHPATFFVNVADTGAEIPSLLRDDESMFAWCDEVQLYWLANKRPPATGLWLKHMTEGPMAQWLSDRTLAQLRANPPDLIVTMLDDTAHRSHPISQWIASNYSPLPNNNARLPLALHARNGSDLSARTRAAALP